MHSPERTFSEVKVRRPLRVSQECTALVARIIGIATRSAPCPMSVSTIWLAPARTASSASARMRASPACSAFAAPARRCSRSRTAASPKCCTIAAKRAFDTNGLSSCRISVCELSWSSTFFRLPNRVFRLITRCSRKLSIGGLVTWLKFCRK